VDGFEFHLCVVNRFVEFLLLICIEVQIPGQDRDFLRAARIVAQSLVSAWLCARE